jgi:hypothetical protein
MRRHAKVRAALVAATVVLVAARAAIAGSGIRTERVRFARGATSAVVEGTIKGDDTVDYVLGAAAGQSMNVSMATKHTAAYFNILAPGENEVALFNGSVGENQYEGVLTRTGDYKIRVYLMRSAARRNEVARYRLEMIVTGASAGAKPGSTPSGDAVVPGTGYHATGTIPCSMGGGQPTGSCSFGVIRQGGGSGVVTVTKPDGRTRSIVFEKGRATGADTSAADPGAFSAAKESDLNVIRIGPERYEIPDAVINGG